MKEKYFYSSITLKISKNKVEVKKNKILFLKTFEIIIILMKFLNWVSMTSTKLSLTERNFLNIITTIESNALNAMILL
jgi:hypothetical protein